MVKFQCKRSGNFVAFSGEDDIRQMRTHEGYDEVKDETNSNETLEIPQAYKAQKVLKRGRPRKTVMEI